MPCYFFDLQHDTDTLGMELPDADAAHQTAVRYAGDILRDLTVDAHDSFYWRMDVRQDSGPTLFSLVLDIVAVPTGAQRHVEAAAPVNDRMADGSSCGWHLV